ncbi:hypothetical protein AURDEDRAFT_128246 [Auricularia subglabra TFB-10046 SS5]|nr:hypothetical protein AURDEDRAFT_128246 [Auricularia subglabra TFB-10046 SS5]
MRGILLLNDSSGSDFHDAYFPMRRSPYSDGGLATLYVSGPESDGSGPDIALGFTEAQQHDDPVSGSPPARMASSDCNLDGVTSALNRLSGVLDARSEVIVEIQQAVANVHQQGNAAAQLQALAHSLAEQCEMLQGAASAFSELVRRFRAGVAVQSAVANAKNAETEIIGEWLATLPEAVSDAHASRLMFAMLMRVPLVGPTGPLPGNMTMRQLLGASVEELDTINSVLEIEGFPSAGAGPDEKLRAVCNAIGVKMPEDA